MRGTENFQSVLKTQIAKEKKIFTEILSVGLNDSVVRSEDFIRQNLCRNAGAYVESRLDADSSIHIFFRNDQMPNANSSGCITFRKAIHNKVLVRKFHHGFRTAAVSEEIVDLIGDDIQAEGENF